MNFAALDLNLLRVFDAMMVELSTVRTGERIGLSQPAMSNALARMRVAFRHRRVLASVVDPAVVTVGDLVVDTGARRAAAGGAVLELTRREFDLLAVLARNAGRPVSKNDLSEQGLGRPLARFDRNIDVHLSSLRHKLGTLSDGRSCLQTVYRLGYQLIRE